VVPPNWLIQFSSLTRVRRAERVRRATALPPLVARQAFLVGGKRRDDDGIVKRARQNAAASTW
jgi:hypothetical protein